MTEETTPTPAAPDNQQPVNETATFKYKKIAIIGSVVILVAALAVISSSLGLFQGNMFRGETKKAAPEKTAEVQLSKIFNFVSEDALKVNYGSFRTISADSSKVYLNNIDREVFGGNLNKVLPANTLSQIAELMVNGEVLLAQGDRAVLLVVKDNNSVITLSEERKKVPRKVKRKAAAATREVPDKCEKVCTQKHDGYLLIANNQETIDKAINQYKVGKQNIGKQLRSALEKVKTTESFVVEHDIKNNRVITYAGADTDSYLQGKKEDKKSQPTIKVDGDEIKEAEAEAKKKAEEEAKKPKYDDPFMAALDAHTFTVDPAANQGNAIIAQKGNDAVVMTVIVPGYIYKKPEGGVLNVFADVSLCASKELTGCYSINSNLIQQDLTANATADFVANFAYNMGLVDGDEFDLTVSLTDVVTKSKTVYKSGNKYILKALPAITQPAASTDTEKKTEEKKVETAKPTEVVAPVTIPATKTYPTAGSVEIMEVYDSQDGNILYHEHLGGSYHPAVKLKLNLDPTQFEEGQQTNMGIDVCSVQGQTAAGYKCLAVGGFGASVGSKYSTPTIETVLNKEDIYYPLKNLNHPDGGEIYFRVSEAIHQKSDSIFMFSLSQSNAKAARAQTDADATAVQGFSDKYDPVDNFPEGASLLAHPIPESQNIKEKNPGHGPHQLSTYNYDSKDYFKIDVKGGYGYEFTIADESAPEKLALEVVESGSGCSISGNYNIVQNLQLTYQPSQDGTFCFAYKTIKPTNTAYTVQYKVVSMPEAAPKEE